MKKATALILTFVLLLGCVPSVGAKELLGGVMVPQVLVETEDFFLEAKSIETITEGHKLTVWMSNNSENLLTFSADSGSIGDCFVPIVGYVELAPGETAKHELIILDAPLSLMGIDSVSEMTLHYTLRDKTNVKTLPTEPAVLKFSLPFIPQKGYTATHAELETIEGIHLSLLGTRFFDEIQMVIMRAQVDVDVEGLNIQCASSQLFFYSPENMKQGSQNLLVGLSFPMTEGYESLTFRSLISYNQFQGIARHSVTITQDPEGYITEIQNELTTGKYYDSYLEEVMGQLG